MIRNGLLEHIAARQPGFIAVDRRSANHALWFWSDKNLPAGHTREGLEPGSFFKSLYEAIARADDTNRDRLARVYPSEVAAWRLVDRHIDGIDVLRALALAGIQT